MSIFQVEPCPPPPPPASGGGADGSAQAFEQVFAVASDVWVCVHNLGFVPNVGTYGTNGKGIGGHVESNTTTTTVVSFYHPVAGRMNLS